MSAVHTLDNEVRVTRILEVKTETPTVKTFTFKDSCCAKAKPGQFLMLWIPGVDEIPLSILDVTDSSQISVAIKRVGIATSEAHAKKPGQLIGIRGPFGNNFSPGHGRVLMVGGGTGIAPLWFLARKSWDRLTRLMFVEGAKTQSELLLYEQIQKAFRGKKLELSATTEDGSCGVKGLCTEPLDQILNDERFDIVYACGPEIMIRKVFDMAVRKDLKFEASLERMMRCAMGLCGSCILGQYLVCRDGPVFTRQQLESVSDEFGYSRRDSDGHEIHV